MYINASSDTKQAGNTKENEENPEKQPKRRIE
jgi:hypothetical protein